MKIFKYLFFLFLIFIIGGAIYIATLENKYVIEKEQSIAAPPEMVFNQLNQLKNWEDWAVWLEDESKVGISYEEITKGTEAKMSWNGTNGLDGNLTNLDVHPTDSLTQQLIVHNASAKSKNTLQWQVKPTKEGTHLTYKISGERGFTEKAMQLIKNTAFSTKLEKAFSKSIQKLEASLDKKMKTYTINVDGITQHGGGFYMYLTTASKNNPTILKNKMLEMYPRIAQFMEENNIQKSGSPFLLYNEINENSGTAIISAGIPTPNKVVTPTESDILNGFKESKKVLKTTLKGSYTNMEEAWQTAENYIKNNSFEQVENATPFVVYVNDSRTEVNPANWITEIYIPVRKIGVKQETTPAAEQIDL